MGTGRLSRKIQESKLTGRRQTAREFLLWVTGRRKRYKVGNVSMAPTLKHGDTLLVDPEAYRKEPPAPGDVLVVQHPLTSQVLVKRAGVIADGTVELRSDNPQAAQDSRHFGDVCLSRVIGRVTVVIG